MLLNIILAVIAAIIIYWGITFLIGTGIGLIIYGLKWLFYATITAISYIIISVCRGLWGLIKGIYRKIRDMIMDRLHPDEGVYYIRFGPADKKGASRVKIRSSR